MEHWLEMGWTPFASNTFSKLKLAPIIFSGTCWNQSVHLQFQIKYREEYWKKLYWKKIFLFAISVGVDDGKSIFFSRHGENIERNYSVSKFLTWWDIVNSSFQNFQEVVLQKETTHFYVKWCRSAMSFIHFNHANYGVVPEQ